MKEMMELAKKMRVLYVEDNEEARESMVGLLQNIFDDVTIATDGEDGLKKFRQIDGIDLIITDINMPKMNGMEMVAKVREEDEDVFILILSAHNEAEYFAESNKQRVDGYLYKPLESKQFIDTISGVVAKFAQKKS